MDSANEAQTHEPYTQLLRQFIHNKGTAEWRGAIRPTMGSGLGGGDFDNIHGSPGQISPFVNALSFDLACMFV